jgi:hypothetical protein
MRGVPREREAMAAAPSRSIRAPMIVAERSMITCSSAAG